MNRFLVLIGLSFLVMFAGCGKIDEVIQTSNKKDTLVIMRTVGEAEVFTQKKIIADDDIIYDVRDAFAEADWQEEELDGERGFPDFRIETYDVWVPDQAAQVETQDIESEEYARLSEEQSAIVIQLIIDAFH